MNELIRSLRACAAGHCDERCGRFYYGMGCRSVLMSEAADAIERRTDEYKDKYLEMVKRYESHK
jgi:hypothetical protein